MNQAFFPESNAVEAHVVSRLPKCGKCGLYKHCSSPKMEPTGKGRRGILIVGESPGQQEDNDGVQFVGKAGRHLRRILGNVGCDLDRDCWKTNSVICHPSGNLTDRNHMNYCRPNLFNSIETLKPKTIICLGVMASESLIAGLWQDDFGSMARWSGWNIPCQKYNAWICPIYHPSYALRQDDSVLDRMIQRDFHNAIKHENRPWERVPDYRKRIELIYDPNQVKFYIDKFIEKGDVIAFDYETNRLKPDTDDAKIVSCSICFNGWRTIAFPWHGTAIEATGRLLQSKIKKVASNLKFEDRWTWKYFGHGVRNWYWDTMLAAHILDNRSYISGLKFQAFVLLGQENYDKRVEPYLKGDKGGVNRIDEIDLSNLLIYNGMDALLEYEVAMLQMKEMGIAS